MRPSISESGRRWPRACSPRPAASSFEFQQQRLTGWRNSALNGSRWFITVVLTCTRFPIFGPPIISSRFPVSIVIGIQLIGVIVIISLVGISFLIFHRLSPHVAGFGPALARVRDQSQQSLVGADHKALPINHLRLGGALSRPLPEGFPVVLGLPPGPRLPPLPPPCPPLPPPRLPLDLAILSPPLL